MNVKVTHQPYSVTQSDFQYNLVTDKTTLAWSVLEVDLSIHINFVGCCNFV